MVCGEQENGFGESPWDIYFVKYANCNTLSLKNLRNSIKLNPDIHECFPCNDIYTTDVRKKHIRNRRLHDLSFCRPTCCKNIYNSMVDRKKLKKLQKFGLTRPVRDIVSDLKPEEIEKCIPKVTIDHPVIYVDEGYVPPEDDSLDGESDYYYLACESGSISECSGCSTVGEMTRTKLHLKKKLHWKDLLHGSEVEYCRNLITKELTKYKGKSNAILKLKSNF